jgi:polar amino acid transport system permease protein
MKATKSVTPMPRITASKIINKLSSLIDFQYPNINKSTTTRSHRGILAKIGLAFVLSPKLIVIFNICLYLLIQFNIIEALTIRDFNFLWRGIIALVFAYSAFIAEIFRAGIESVDHGQVEAAKALGFSRWRMFFPVIFPQAVRNVLPSLANEVVAIVKDSALVSILGVADITQIGKVYAISTFKYVESYNIVAFCVIEYIYYSIE